MKHLLFKYGIFIILPLIIGIIITVSVSLKPSPRINALLLAHKNKPFELFVPSNYITLNDSNTISIEFNNSFSQKAIIDTTIYETQYTRFKIRFLDAQPHIDNTLENVNIILDKEPLYMTILKKINF